MRQKFIYKTEEQKRHKYFILYVLMVLCLNFTSAAAQETANARQAKRIFNTAWNHIFGKEGADGMLAHAKERKAAGYQYCDCAACAAVEAILEKKSELV